MHKDSHEPLARTSGPSQPSASSPHSPSSLPVPWHTHTELHPFRTGYRTPKPPHYQEPAPTLSRRLRLIFWVLKPPPPGSPLPPLSSLPPSPLLHPSAGPMKPAEAPGLEACAALLREIFASAVSFKSVGGSGRSAEPTRARAPATRCTRAGRKRKEWKECGELSEAKRSTQVFTACKLLPLDIIYQCGLAGHGGQYNPGEMQLAILSTPRIEANITYDVMNLCP